MDAAPPGFGCVTATSVPAPGFADPDLFAWLEAAGAGDLDALPFGLIAMAPDGKVDHYNAWEATHTGLSRAHVTGRHFFTAVGRCFDAELVGQRFATEPDLDDILVYVIAFKLMLRNVRLRLLRRAGGRRMYLAIQTRG